MAGICIFDRPCQEDLGLVKLSLVQQVNANFQQRLQVARIDGQCFAELLDGSFSIIVREIRTGSATERQVVDKLRTDLGDRRGVGIHEFWDIGGSSRLA